MPECPLGSPHDHYEMTEVKVLCRLQRAQEGGGATTIFTMVFGASYVAAPGKIFDSICQTMLKKMSFWER